MKVSNLKKKLAASLLAVGMISPGAAYSAGLGANLLDDPSFENLSNSQVQGAFGSRALSSWSDGSAVGYAYKYEAGFDNPGLFANDPNDNPPSPGLSYYTANFNGDSDATDGDDVNAPGQAMQIVDVSSGDSATAIAAGQANYWISGYFGAYSDSVVESATLQVDFLDVTGASLGAASVTGTVVDWNSQSASGPIPVGTTSVQASVFIANAGASGLGFMDLANFTINAVPEPSTGLLTGLGIVGMGAFRRKRKS